MTGKIVSRTSTIELKGPLDQVFPLFGPVREQEWDPSWRPRFVLPYAEPVGEHMVFQTDGPDPRQPATFTWIISKFQPAPALVEYTVFTDSRIWWITIHCQQAPSRPGTRAEVTYTYLGLSDEANRANEAALKAMFRHDLKDWEAAINDYLDGARAQPGSPGTEAP